MRLFRSSQLVLVGLLLAGGVAAQDTDAPQTPPIPDGYSAVAPLSDAPEQTFSAPEEVLEPDTDYGAVLATNKGTMVLDLYEDEAPETVNNFVFLARHGFYDGIVFHRVLDGFMAQTGDPTGTGRGGPGYEFDDEFSDTLSFDRAGILGMANAGPGTNGSQFFITFAETPWLDGAHTIFGEVIEGAEVLDDLTRVDPSQEAPGLVVPPSDPLSVVQEQGIALSGDPDTTVEAYLTAELGEFPPMGQRFNVEGVTGLIGQGEGGAPLVGFYTPPDVIASLTIIARDAE